MKKLTLLFSIVLFASSSCLVSCKKNNNRPDPIQTPTPIKSAKFEITGNYSGQLLVVYNDNVSGNTSVVVTSLPWSKTIDYPNSVIGIGIGGNTSNQSFGVSGQTATVKIYNGTSVVKSGSAIADGNGVINLPTLAYTFP